MANSTKLLTARLSGRAEQIDDVLDDLLNMISVLNTKRLSRYIEKTKKNHNFTGLLEAMKTSAILFYSDRKDEDDNYELSFGFNQKLLSAWGLDESGIEDVRGFYNEQLSYYFSDLEHINDVEINVIADVAFNEVCEVYLCGYMQTHSDINTNNFVNQAIPDVLDLTVYSGWYTRAFYRDFFLYIILNALPVLRVFAEKEVQDRIVAVKQAQSIQRLQEENEKLMQQNLKLRKENETLSQDVIQDALLDEISAAHDELKRKHLKLERKYNSLNEKYQALRNSIGEDTDEDYKEIEISTEIDANGRYVFFGKFYDTFKNKILEAFPNSKIYASINSDDVNIMNCDLVICAASYISHSFYYKIKNKCIANNIPFLSTNHRNVDLMKADIAKYFADHVQYSEKGVII